jgi:predicted tellurium resistance membrane protein TerC
MNCLYHSVDNLFVFIMLFDYFKVPLQYQARVLTWGIIGAVAMRGVMIGLGVAAVQRFRGIILAFAVSVLARASEPCEWVNVCQGILIASAVKLLKEDDSEEDLENNFVMKISRASTLDHTHVMRA